MSITTFLVSEKLELHFSFLALHFTFNLKHNKKEDGLDNARSKAKKANSLYEQASAKQDFHKEVSTRRSHLTIIK
jgi:hypothetical protein